jgi:cell division transport system permease protein
MSVKPFKVVKQHNRTIPIIGKNNKPSLKEQWHAYGVNHAYAGFSSIGRLTKMPWSNLLTICVIGIALALPVGLFLMVLNTQKLTSAWDKGTTLSIYLKAISLTELKQFETELLANKNIRQIKYIDPEAGLKSFMQTSGLSASIAELPNNPIPGVIEIIPVARLLNNVTELQTFATDLRRYTEVDSVQVDMAWVKRLAAILFISKRLIVGLALLLSTGVVFIIGNTIRLTIQSHHEEIEVIKLVGGTDSFIRLPFLYTGLIYGIMGGMMTVVIVETFFYFIASAASQLIVLYNNGFVLQGLTFAESIALLVIGGLLGLGGAWIAVNQQLSDLN